MKHFVNRKNNCPLLIFLLLTFFNIAPFNVPMVFSENKGENPAGLLFEKKCFSCHNIGGGDKKGPDLEGLTGRRSQQWITNFIKSPSSVFAKGDSDAVLLFKKFAPEKMPDQDISDDQIISILELITKLTKDKKKFVPLSLKLPREIKQSDIPIGKKLFSGEIKFQHKIPPCVTCHSIGGVGILGGGTLGPELTKSGAKFSDAELVAILNSPTFPNMAKLLVDKKFTDDELVALVAFLKDAKKSVVTSNDTKFKIILIGMVLLIIVIFFISLLLKNRTMGVRRALVGR
jgi:mono/diheme cytochrome c family protein